jgi:hypothetical protein
MTMRQIGVYKRECALWCWRPTGSSIYCWQRLIQVRNCFHIIVDYVKVFIKTGQANTSSFYTGMAKKPNYTTKGLRIETKVEEIFNATLDGECMLLGNKSAKGASCAELRGFICEQM